MSTNPTPKNVTSNFKRKPRSRLMSVDRDQSQEFKIRTIKNVKPSKSKFKSGVVESKSTNSKKQVSWAETL